MTITDAAQPLEPCVYQGTTWRYQSIQPQMAPTVFESEKTSMLPAFSCACDRSGVERHRLDYSSRHTTLDPTGRKALDPKLDFRKSMTSEKVDRSHELEASVQNHNDCLYEPSLSTASTAGENSLNCSPPLMLSCQPSVNELQAPCPKPQETSCQADSVSQHDLSGNYATSHSNPNRQDPSSAGRNSDMMADLGRKDKRSVTVSSQQLSAALSDLAGRNGTPATARFPALGSPCFYHQRFEDAVNIDRILEEIKDDEWMSHSRLMQTATSVREVARQLQRRPIKRAVTTVMIVTKARDNQLVKLTRDLTEWLMRTPRYGWDIGVNVFVDAKLRASKRFDADGLIRLDPRFRHMLRYWTPSVCCSQPETFDLVLTLGGDGTVLFTSWLFQRIVPPVLSFSLGSLGFLTNFEYHQYQEHLTRVMGDDGMRVNLRMRFTCTIYRNRTNKHSVSEGEQFEVLNELVIDRGPSPYVSNLELYGDDELLTIVQADGCIFSTPTGSTAYSLSAGGSLVHPDIPAILLTPICPHTLSFRPMVLSDTLLLRIAVPRQSRATAYCSFDGKGRVELKQGDTVTIAASQYPFPTVVRKGAEWYDSVSRTLRWNTREATQKGWDASADTTDAEPESGFDIDADSAFYQSEDCGTECSPHVRPMSLLGS